MDPAATFRVRSARLQERLDWLDGAMQPGAKARDGTYSEFRKEIAKLQKETKEGLAGQSATKGGWAALNLQEASCERVFREALQWLLTMKRELVSPGVLELVEAVVADLAFRVQQPAPGIVPDVAETFSDYVPIIRMRFPAPDIWDVPALAHEFGHYVAYRLTLRENADIGRRQPLADVIEQNVAGQDDKEKKQRKHVINELFADMFATYAAGLAFPASLLLLRSDLALPYLAVGQTHPSFAQRAACVLFTIQQMSREPEADAQERPVLAWLHTELSRRWKALLASTEAGAATDFAPSRIELFQAVIDMAKAARYDGWTHAQYVVRHVVGGRVPAAAGTSFTGADLLNASWLELINGGDPTELSERVLALWRAYGKKQELAN